MFHSVATDKWDRLIVSAATHQCTQDESYDDMWALPSGSLSLDNLLDILNTCENR